jgi:glycogen operon protein
VTTPEAKALSLSPDTESLKVLPGSPAPLGASFDGAGVNFAVYSEHARRLWVCLFDSADPRRETHRFELGQTTHHVFHGYVRGLRPGLLYGLRAEGPYDPERGLRFNAHKLLVDPYARALTGKVDFSQPVHGYPLASEEGDLVACLLDDAPAVPKAVVLTDAFDWGDERRPNVEWHQVVLYEVHVKGFSMKHPDIAPELRGTYSGLCAPAALEHFKKLGVTSLELLPVHEAVDEGFLAERGLTNYWGYSTLGFFAPDQRFSSRGSRGAQVTEFKHMVKTLHAAGIEVILDVVYNHTGEGNHLGPTLSFKGLDNPTYYRLRPDEPRHYADVTGTGNSWNASHPQALKLVMDSLRYWATEMRVDGFRFDLAPALGRNGHGGYDRNATFFQMVHQDPVLSRLKLIAEPWDIGDGGYQIGNFPVLWSEWNGKYRETTRRFWRGNERQVAELGYRLSGSSDLYQLSGRRPYASINYVTCHDGFTLRDLVSYNEKHNEANREGNRDGSNDNDSWNCGVEGETDDADINALRQRQMRNFMATLMLSQGVPMLCAGDELGKTQGGNNNAYCQDNERSWLDWNLDAPRRAFLEFTAQMARLRRSHPVLRRRKFFQGAHLWDSALKDVAWFRPDGEEMTIADWSSPETRALGYLLGGDAIMTPDSDGNRIMGDTLLILLNATEEALTFTLPAIEWGQQWEIEVDTAHAEVGLGKTPAGGHLVVEARTLMVLRHPPKG